ELWLANWPAAVRDPVSRFEVRRVQRSAVRLPVVGVPTEVPLADGIERQAGRGVGNDVVDGMVGGFRDQTAILEEDHPDRGVRKLPGERDTGGARTHHA